VQGAEKDQNEDKYKDDEEEDKYKDDEEEDKYKEDGDDEDKDDEKDKDKYDEEDKDKYDEEDTDKYDGEDKDKDNEGDKDTNDVDGEDETPPTAVPTKKPTVSTGAAGGNVNAEEQEQIPSSPPVSTGAAGGNLDSVNAQEQEQIPSSPPVGGATSYPPEETTGSGSSSSGGGICVFCDDPGFIVDPSLKVDNVSCADWEIAAWTNPPFEDCVLLRATAVAYCECPLAGSSVSDTNGQVVGEICQDICLSSEKEDEAVSRQFDSSKQLPNSQLTCADVLNLPAVDGDETCRVIEETYGFWCGCSGVLPPCTLCETGLPPSRPNAQFSITGETCGTIANTVATVPTSRCSEYKAGLDVSLGYDAQGFCGCFSDDFLEEASSTSSSNYTCDVPCPAGTVYASETEQTNIVPDWDAPCADWTNRLPFITNSTLCESVQKEIVGPVCCIPGTNDGSGSTESAAGSSSETSTIQSRSTPALVPTFCYSVMLMIGALLAPFSLF
jgi:hypothetical protein